MGTLSRRYAQALLAFATEAGTDRRVYDEAGWLSHALMHTPTLRHAMENPRVSLAGKQALLAGLTDDGTLSGTMQRFVQLVTDKHREHHLLFMLRTYTDLYRTEHHIRLGQVTTAVPLSPDMAGRLKQALERITGDVAVVENHVDAGIEGGFILQVDNVRLDASVRGQMQRIRKQFTDMNKRIV